MANPRPNDENLQGLRRANRDNEQHVHYQGWEVIEGGRRNPLDEASVAADYTRAPFDESLVRDEQGRLLDTRNDAVHGYGEPRPEKNYPKAYDRADLVNTDLNPMMEYPKKTTATYNILAVVLALVVFTLVLVAMFWNFLPPVRRSPERPNGAVQATRPVTAQAQPPADLSYRHEIS